MIKLLVAGACGKMGAQILSLAAKDSAFKITGAFESKGHARVGKPLSEILGIEGLNTAVTAGIESVVKAGDVVIDFTHRDATPEHVRACQAAGLAMVIGTTGLSEETLQTIKQASQKIAIVQSPNMSAGVNLLFKLTELVASKLSDEYDIEIVEAHHRHKKDAPSGTALELARSAARGRKVDLSQKGVYGREGLTGERPRGEIGVHAVRGGDVVGDHTVSFMAEGERVELTHKASSREAFAKGALLAAKFVAGKKTGLYTMHDVLGL